MIKLLNVRKGFNLGKANEFIAVGGVTLSMEAHRVTVLKGPSGSGKTTLLSLIGCMARPTSGRITLQNGLLGGRRFPGVANTSEVEVTSLPERFLTEIRRQTFGFIFQQFNLVKGITRPGKCHAAVLSPGRKARRSSGSGRLPSWRCSASGSAPPRRWNGSPAERPSGWRSPGR